MAINYNGENVLTYVLTLLKTKFNTKVDKVAGKGLSTNDYTNDEKSKLAGLTNYTHPTYTARTSGLYKITVNNLGHVTAVTAVSKDDITKLGIPGQDTTYVVATSELDGLMSKEDFVKLAGIAEGANNYSHPTYTAKSSGFYKITVDGTGHVSSATAVSKTDITSLGIPGSVPTISTNVESDATSDTKTVSPKAVKTYVDGKVSSTYKPAGSIAFASLPTPSASVLGNVYNITNDFTTTSSFLEGAGKSYSAGTNVMVVLDGSNYKFDVLSGFVDLSDYLKSSDLVEYTNTEVQAIWDSVFNA